MPNTPFFSLGTNPIWLTIGSHPDLILVQARLLGLGPDHSLLCGLPVQPAINLPVTGQSCKGRSYIDGDIFEFETVIQDIRLSPLTLRLEAPTKISKQRPRTLPRLLVSLPGTVRPMNETGHILAVLPVILVNLSPTGCQFQVPISAWPSISSLNIQLSCRLPGLHHYSRIKGRWEFVLYSILFMMVARKTFIVGSPRKKPV